MAKMYARCFFLGIFMALTMNPSFASPQKGNKAIIEKYMEGFREGNHAKVLSTLTNDVEWVLPGAFHLVGKAAFNNEIENPAFEGKPEITVSRLTEEDGVIVAEGAVRAKKKDGPYLNLVFCDVFEMQGEKIRKLTSYLMELKGVN